MGMGGHARACGRSERHGTAMLVDVADILRGGSPHNEDFLVINDLM